MEMEIKKKFDEMSVLSPLLFLYTLVYLGMMIGDFVARDKFDMPSGIMAVYIALVGAYAADKEIRRWMRKERASRNGALFVYAWMIFYLVAFTIFSLKPEYTLPKDLMGVTVQVFAVFFGSKASKKIFEKYGQEAPESGEMQAEEKSDQSHGSTGSPCPTDSDSEKIILEHIRENGRAQRDDLMVVTKLSRSSLGRFMDQLEAKGLVEQVGDRKGAYYRIKV